VDRRYNGAHTGEEESPCVLKHAPPSDLSKVEGKAELVHGEIVHMSPAGEGPSMAGEKFLRISASTPDTGGKVGHFLTGQTSKSTCRALSMHEYHTFLADLPVIALEM